jgi:Thioredoxin
MTWRFARQWDEALTFERFVAESKQRSEMWAAVYRTARLPDGLVAEAAALGRPWRLLAIVEDWCGDAINTIPVVARWVERVPGLELRLVRRDQHPDLMDAYLTGTSRSIPIVIVLTEIMEEVGHWGPRPGALQAWVLERKRAGAGKELYPEIRKWYAQDRGETALREILAVMTSAGTVQRWPDRPAAGGPDPGAH